MKAGDFLNTLAQLAGVPSDNEALKAILSSQTFTESEIDDTLVNTIKGNFLTMESAKANQDLHNHFKATVLNGVDARTNDVMAAYPAAFTAEEMARIKAMPSSYDRIDAMAKALDTYHTAQRKDGGNEQEVDTLRAEITKLNQTILDEKAQRDQLVNTHQTQLINQEINHASNATIGALSFGNALPTSDYITLTQQKADADLEGKGVIKRWENNTIKLVTDNDGTMLPYMVDNQEVSYADHVAKVAADNKFLNVSGDTPPPPPPAAPPASNGQAAPDMSSYHAAVDSATADVTGAGSE